jgi:hypothetical protein
VSKVNVFVLGLDDLNLEALNDLHGSSECRFHPLLSVDELLEAEPLRVDELLDKAERQLDDFDGSVDAVVGYWDFPVSSMVPLLCARRNLPGPNLDAVVMCEHKYWSRLEQQKAIKEHPRFGIVDLEGEPEVPSGLRFPMWLKPVKSASSELAFHVSDEGEFEEAVRAIREGIDTVGKPFEAVLRHVDLPAEVADAGGRACLAEEEAKGQQITVEGYCFAGEARPYGIIDSFTYPESTSFLKFQYPSLVPEEVATRLVDVSRRVMEQIGLRWGTFNIEFFWDQESGAISVLEVNPRHSQSHAFMFEYVDGLPNHQIMVELGLGREPRFTHAEGAYSMAAKWHLRRFEDGVVRRCPTQDEVDRVEREVPGVKVSIVVEKGDRLSELAHQDSYSYEVADFHIGARDEAELREKYDRCVEALPFDFDA